MPLRQIQLYPALNLQCFSKTSSTLITNAIVIQIQLCQRYLSASASKTNVTLTRKISEMKTLKFEPETRAILR